MPCVESNLTCVRAMIHGREAPSRASPPRRPWLLESNSEHGRSFHHFVSHPSSFPLGVSSRFSRFTLEEGKWRVAASVLTDLRLPCYSRPSTPTSTASTSALDHMTLELRAMPGWVQTLCTSSTSSITVRHFDHSFRPTRTTKSIYLRSFNVIRKETILTTSFTFPHC